MPGERPSEGADGLRTRRKFRGNSGAGDAGVARTLRRGPRLSLLSWIYALVGLFGLAWGADRLVDGSSGLARRFRVSPLVIGLTVVAYGTSAPEIGASLVAVLRESPGLAVGNVIGSNAANLGLILGITAVVCPFVVARGLMRREFGLMLLSTLLLWPFAASGVLPRAAGIAFLVGLAGFNLASVRWGRETDETPAGGNRDDPPGAARPQPSPEPLGRNLGLTALGLAVLLVGAELLVRGASDIARDLGVSETTIGFTLVALGTSLPELAASIAAVRAGQVQMAAGNVIGSNLFNVLGALGLAAVAAPVAMDPALARGEIPGVVVITLLAGLFMLTGRRVARIEGILLLASYAAFVVFVIL